MSTVVFYFELVTESQCIISFVINNYLVLVQKEASTNSASSETLGLFSACAASINVEQLDVGLRRC